MESCEGKKVHVVGDTIVDSLTYTTMIGGMTKTPTLSVRFDNRVDFIGGAAVVAKHLRAAGAEVTFSTVLGDDPLKDFVLQGLADVRRQMPADHRPRAADDPQERLRLRRLPAAQGRHARQPQHLRQAGGAVLRSRFAASKAEAVVFSDFRHGIFNRRTIPS